MQEKEIIKATKWTIKGVCIALIVIGVIVWLIVSKNYADSMNHSYETYNPVSGTYFTGEYKIDTSYFLTSILPFCASYTLLPFVVVSIILHFMVNKTELIVTDKRVYGNAMFGKRVDLPVDSISAVGTSMLKGIAVATSSGRIKFLGISNRDEIHKVLSDLIVGRQEKPISNTVVKQEVQQSSADELKKYKELFDQGIISQEEFDAKKKQLLGL